MTKKQRKEVAIIWTATMLAQSGTDSFHETDTTFEDQEGILEEVERLSEKILGNRPYILTLPRIIEWVRNNK